MVEVWGTPQCSITDVRILFIVGADPAALYEGDLGEKVLADRKENGSVCSLCAPKYKEFLQFARDIYDAQFNTVSIVTVHS